LSGKRGSSAHASTTPFPYTRPFSAEYHNRSLDVLETALNRVAAYQSWQAFDPGRRYSADVRYAAMPAFAKKDIREHFPQGMLPPDRDVKSGLASGEIEFVKTSGTVDVAVTNIWYQKWWNASENASWKLNSYASKVATGNHREALLTSSLNVGYVSDDIDLPMEKRQLSRFLYLNEKTSALIWTPEFMDRIIKELEVYKPVVLEANPSYLAKLCRYATARRKTVFQPELIVFSYENPLNFHYRQIRQVFKVPMMNSYGATEVGCVFTECEKGRLHQNSEYCRVDFQPLKPEHGGPTLGRILVTTFNNPWYVLVRFDVGDLVRLDNEGACACGRDSGIILSVIEGRTAGVTLTCKGRLVTPRELDNSLSILDGIDEYQLNQVTKNSYQLNLVSQRADKPKLSQEASEVLTELYGEEAKISVIFEKAITTLPSGKYSLSQALFPINIEDFLDERYFFKRNT
jgi:phenylacetate-coenzyme A ligase PaaK-like adenylate-forming protein